MHAESFERPVNLIEIMAAGRRSCTKSDAFVAALLPRMGYQSPSPPRDVGDKGGGGVWRHRRRGCRLRGTDRPQIDHASSQAVLDPRVAELWYDFAALQGAGTPGATAQAGFVPAPEPPLASQPNKRCSRATWPFFDDDCLWGDAAEDGTRERRRRRIVARLKSPWCSGLHSNDGAYFCRSRS
jgi:hypothetical protein